MKFESKEQYNYEDGIIVARGSKGKRGVDKYIIGEAQVAMKNLQ